jgi:hypothetical protein
MHFLSFVLRIILSAFLSLNKMFWIHKGNERRLNSSKLDVILGRLGRFENRTIETVGTYQCLL